MAGWVVQPLLQDNPSFPPLPPSQLISPLTEGEAQLDYLSLISYQRMNHQLHKV